MRIAQIVTFVSSDGAFGGPLTVAIGQTKELARRGHEVDLLAGWDGVATLDIPGVDVNLFPIRRYLRSGFSGITSHALQKHFEAGLSAYDVVHIHLSRDFITIPAAAMALRSGKRVIIQTHGMVMPDRRLKARLFDSFWVRSILMRAAAVLSLTEREEIGLRAVVSGHARIHSIANGIAVDRDRFQSDAKISEKAEVLFLARLHPRKRVMAFAEMASLMATRGSTAQFTVVGPDEGDLPELTRFITMNGLGASLTYEGSLPPGSGAERLANASVFVLPSTGEVFPMTVLEALSVGTPVVLNSDCGIAAELARRGAAIVTDESPTEMADAVESILTVEGIAVDLISSGYRAISEYFSITAVVDVLEGLYSEV